MKENNMCVPFSFCNFSDGSTGKLIMNFTATLALLD